MSDMGTMKFLYREKFPVGSNVRIKDAAELEEFRRTWKLHHPISAEQVVCGGRLDSIRSVGFYHGGDVLYQLKSAPGVARETSRRRLGSDSPVLSVMAIFRQLSRTPPSPQGMAWLLKKGDCRIFGMRKTTYSDLRCAGEMIL